MLIQGRIEKSTTTGLPQIQKRTVEKFLFLTSVGLVGFLLVIVLLQLFGSITGFGATTRPHSLVVQSVTDVSFTVTWQTKTKSSGYVLYGDRPDQLTKKAFDNQASGNMSTFLANDHRVTLTNLDPNTYYYYQIVSDGKDVDSVDSSLLKPVKTALESYLTNPSLGGNPP
ncbi:MAG: fibronectin type III domain-containing protein [bacterium]|nr:fibronectin type III domain-containing protein [bacterium]